MDIPDFLKEHAAYRANVMLVCVCECETVCVCVKSLMHVYDVCPSWAGQTHKGWDGGGYCRVYKKINERE